MLVVNNFNEQNFLNSIANDLGMDVADLNIQLAQEQGGYTKTETVLTVKGQWSQEGMRIVSKDEAGNVFTNKNQISIWFFKYRTPKMMRQTVNGMETFKPIAMSASLKIRDNDGKGTNVRLPLDIIDGLNPSTVKEFKVRLFYWVEQSKEHDLGNGVKGRAWNAPNGKVIKIPYGTVVLRGMPEGEEYDKTRFTFA